MAHPPHLYVRLEPLPSSTTSMVPLDPTSVRLSLLQSLGTHLGDHGAAVPIDILSIDDAADGHERGAIVRVPYGDGRAFCAAVAAVGGLRVERSAEWLDGIVAPVPRGLFDFDRGSNRESAGDLDSWRRHG